MFNVKAVIQEVEQEKVTESEGNPRANCANGAKNEPKVSTFSTFSTPPTSENRDIGKLDSLKLIYGDPDQIDNLDQSEVGIEVPFTDHEIAEHLINTEVHRDDRAFVRQQLLGAYGAERLSRVDDYLKQFKIGAESVGESYKKSNAGRGRANTWLRQGRGKGKFCQLTTTVDSLQATSERSETELE
jgi:hypothetical protein